MRIRKLRASQNSGSASQQNRMLDFGGSKPVRLRPSKKLPPCPRKRTCLPILELLPSPALGERGHRGLARRGVAMGRVAILVMPEGQCPHPRHSYGRGVNLKDAADNGA